MPSRRELKKAIVDYTEALKTAQIMAGLLRLGYVEPVTCPDGQTGYKLTEKGWAEISSLPLPGDWEWE